MGLPCSTVTQVETVALRYLTDQPAKHPSRPHSPSFALTLSFCLSPSSSLPLPGFLIHSFPFITETHSCMGEKHLPAAAVWRQTGGGRGTKRETARRRGNEERVGGGVEVKGRCWPGEGAKNCKYRIGFIPVFQTLEPAVCWGISAPLSGAVPKQAFLLSAGERLAHTRGGLHWL